MLFRSVSQSRYVTDYNSDLLAYNFYTINKETAFATRIGTIADNAWGIDFSSNGTLYGATYDLVTIDPTNGNILSTIGDLSGTSFLSIIDLDITPDGLIYGIDYDSNGSKLYQISAFDASSTLIGTYSSDIWGVASLATFSPPPLSEVTLAISPSTVAEDGTSNLIYTFTRTGVITDALTVNYTVGGTATNGTDYGNIGTSVTFAANSATATVTVDPTTDTAVESDETVSLTLVS